MSCAEGLKKHRWSAVAPADYQKQLFPSRKGGSAPLSFKRRLA
jgi:hypothetical protein